MPIGILILMTLGVTIFLMILLWIVSLLRKDASIVDSFWGIGFAVIAWTSYLFTQGFTLRKLILCSLVTIWGVRLGTHIFSRNHGKGEDYRYQAMRRHHGEKFWLVSLFTVFLFQGLLLWFISMPLQFAQVSRAPEFLTVLDYLGISAWMIGFAFEAVGDWQLQRFKADAANRGKVMDSGLWRYTRHPNYFGDATLWWGYYLIACAVPNGWMTLLSPLTMTFFLMNVSGVSLLEKSLKKSKPAYADYIGRTSAFFPMPPKHSVKSKFVKMN